MGQILRCPRCLNEGPIPPGYPSDVRWQCVPCTEQVRVHAPFIVLWGDLNEQLMEVIETFPFPPLVMGSLEWSQ